MATINMCSEKSSLGTGPRISFSHDHNNTVSIETHHHQQQQQSMCHLDSSSDFVFCIADDVTHKLSSADELFSNGKIIPTQFKRVSNAPQHEPHHQTPIVNIQKKLKEFLSEADEEDNEEDKPNSSSSSLSSSYTKYFWQFNRSSSLNFDGTTRGKRLLRSSLQFLSRSYSTGSAPKHAVIIRGGTERHRLQKQSSASSRSRLSSSSLSSSSSSSASSSAYYFYDSSQKLSLKKNCGSSGNGVRISPVLNLPQHKGTRNFFGFGSLFCNGKKINRKR